MYTGLLRICGYITARDAVQSHIGGDTRIAVSIIEQEREHKY